METYHLSASNLKCILELNQLVGKVAETGEAPEGAVVCKEERWPRLDYTTSVIKMAEILKERGEYIMIAIGR